MNKLTAFLMIVIIALSFVLGTSIQSKAQTKNFAGVIPFVTSKDRVGFFDQTTGRIYMYDDNISQCVYTGQLESLGKAIEPMAKAS